MNINCIICSDIILPSSEIYSTSCGHLFHHICLVQWIQRSSTCPQCRCKATEKTIHRVYFTLANTDCITDDVATLQFKMDNLNFQMTVKDKDLKIYTEKNKKLKDQSAALREEVRTLEQKHNVSESVIHALKEQVSYFKLKAKESNRLNDEVVRLKDKLKDLEHVQMVLTGSREQVNDMLRHNKDPHSLNLLVFTLKKELLQADRKYKLLNTNMRHIQNDLSKYRRENADISKENLKLKNDIESHKNCETERHYLKRKIVEIEERLRNTQINTSHNSINRIITESPAPYKKRNSFDLEIEEGNFASPSIQEKVQDIKDSESPYLSVKSSNVGLSCLMNSRFITNSKPPPSQGNAGSYNIFKNPPPTFENVKIHKEDYCYNGFGGHSKDEKFPIPKPITGLKRSKSAMVSSSKFRKLAPNKKLNDFFTNSNE